MNKIVLFFLVLFSAIVSCHSSTEKNKSLRNEIAKIIQSKNAVVGVSIIDSNGDELFSHNGHRHFPLQSVFKFHIALTVLSQIDAGKFSLDQEILVVKNDLLPGLWSPLREEHPNGGSFTIAKLIEYTVSLSDNVGCDVLLRLVGGPVAVERFIKENGIKDIEIKLNEEKQQSGWDFQFQNWTTPIAASKTLEKFYNNERQLLRDNSYNFIWKVMRETQTGIKRIKGQLPNATVVAHKTGSSGTNNEGITAAVNDIGVVFLPNGKHFFISVFVSNSTEGEEVNEKIIAEIAKVIYDFFIFEN